MAVIHGDETNFSSLTSKGMVLVDFFATWCGPCKMLGPVLEDLASDRSEIEVVKIDVDENETLTRSYGIMSVPTLLLFKDGKVVSQKVGYVPKELLTSWIEENK